MSPRAIVAVAVFSLVACGGAVTSPPCGDDAGPDVVVEASAIDALPDVVHVKHCVIDLDDAGDTLTLVCGDFVSFDPEDLDDAGQPRHEFPCSDPQIVCDGQEGCGVPDDAGVISAVGKCEVQP